MSRVWSLIVALLLVLPCAGCSCNDHDSGHQPAASSSARSKPPPPGANTAGAPRNPPPFYDLVAHLSACSIYHRGLSIDLGNSAARSRRGFSIGPFDDVSYVDREGASFARVFTKRISYEFWLDEPEESVFVGLRLHTGIASRLSTYIDNKNAGSARLGPDETRVVTLPVRRHKLAPGRHTLLLRFWGARRLPQGSKREPYAEIDWLRVGLEDDLSATYAAPTLKDIVADEVLDGRPKRSIVLRAPSTVRCPMRVAPDAKLRVSLGFWGSGKGQAEVRVVADGQPPVTLKQRKVTGGSGATWTPLDLDLGRFAGKLVALELRALDATRGGRIVFGEPAIVHAGPAPGRTPHTDTVVLVIASGLDRNGIPPWGPIGELSALGELTRQGVAFDHYRAPTTVPAGVVASMLSGLPPRAHSLEDHAARLPASVRTINSIVKEASGRTAMFTGVPTTFPAFGFDRGWDRFKSFSPVKDLPASAPITEAADWLDHELSEEPALRLVVIHTRGMHPPWDLTRDEMTKLPPPEYGGVLDARRAGIILAKIRARRSRRRRRLTDDDWSRLRAAEKAAMLKQNAALMKLVAVLKNKGAWDRTLFMFVGNVGAGAPPRIPFQPAGSLTEGRLLLPLIVKFPGNARAGKRTQVPATAVDIARTVLDALGLDLPEHVSGIDLYAGASGVLPVVGRPLIATLGEHYSTRFGSWRLQGRLGRTPSLCRLDIDPACVNDVLDAEPIAARSAWQWTFDAETAATVVRTPREPARINVDTASALTVWGDIR